MRDSPESSGRSQVIAESPELILDQLCQTTGTIPLRALVIVAHPDDETIGAADGSRVSSRAGSSISRTVRLSMWRSRPSRTAPPGPSCAASGDGSC